MAGEVIHKEINGNAIYNDFTKALLSHRMEDLIAAGIGQGQIYKLGFAFQGKDVLVVSGENEV